MVYARANGQTNIVSSGTYTSTVTDKIINLELKTPVTVEDITYAPTPVRTANRIKVQYAPTAMYVGEEFALYAVILNEITDDKKTPYEYADDNIVVYESNNPDICRVKNGVLIANAPGVAEIVVRDIDNTVSTTINVTVEEPVINTITDADIYTVTLPCSTTNGVLHADNTNAEETTLAIQDLLAYCTENNYKKIIFPVGQYIISPAYGSITIPSNLVIDFNNSIINIEESTLTSTGYRMIIFEDAENSKIINANIYGERFTMSLVSGAETCQSIFFTGNCYNSGLEDCTISQSPGFNIGANFKNLVRCGLLLNNIESGKLNDDGSISDETVDYCYRSIDYINISSLKDKFGFGNRQGYEGYSYLSARVYDVYFYDANKEFISCIKDCLQYFIYDKPEGAMYAKIVFYQTFMPTNADGDFNSVAMLYSHDGPDKCFIRRCILEDNYSTAIQPNGGDNWIIEDNIFRRNGYRDPSSHIDWEDGRNNIHGHIVRNNIFEDGRAVTFVGGSCMVFHNNTLINCSLNQGSEVQNSRIWLNHFKGSKSASTVQTKTDMVFAQNYFGNGATYTVTNTSNVNFIVHDFNNSIQ